MDKFSLELKHVGCNEELEIDGISFSRCSFVRLRINDKFDNLKDFPDSLLVFSELKRSLTDSGRYLIFTCACGIADDGGWECVEVLHEERTINWRFFRDQEFRFKFHKNSYIKEIARCAELIKSLPSDLNLKPTNFVFPEDEPQ